MKRKISIICIIVACLACLFVCTASAYHETPPSNGEFETWTEVPTTNITKAQYSLASVSWDDLPDTRGGLANLYAVRVIKGDVNYAALEQTGDTSKRSIFRFIPYRYGYDANSTNRGYVALYYYEFASGYSALEVGYYQYDGTQWHNTTFLKIDSNNYGLHLNWVQAAYFYDETADAMRFTLVFNVDHLNESQTYVQAYEVNRQHASGYVHQNLDVFLELENTHYDSEYPVEYSHTATYTNGLIGTGTAQGLALSEQLYRISDLTTENEQLRNIIASDQEIIDDLRESLANVDAAGGIISGLFGGAIDVADTFLGLGFGGITIGSVLAVAVIGLLIYVVLRFVRG